MFAYTKPNHKPKDAVPKKEQTTAPNQTGIPDAMKSRFEHLSGFSFDDVRVHYNSDKPTQLRALAYTQGNQVYVAPGQERHLGHELGHVMQQKEGRVRANTAGGRINDDPALEREAESLGRAAGDMIQCFNVPVNLTEIRTDVANVEAEIAGNATPGDIPGGDTWATDTRAATLRKLNEWYAFTLAARHSVAVPQFGEDVVTEPDVFEAAPGGLMTNVVENKFVTGERNRITPNVKDAMSQLILSGRSPNYTGRLTARVELSDVTREDLRASGSPGGDTIMLNGWIAYGRALRDFVTKPHSMWLNVVNLPDRNTGGNSEINRQIFNR